MYDKTPAIRYNKNTKYWLLKMKENKNNADWANLPNIIRNNSGKKSAFTLVETIMTLFIISVVITASIIVFTGKHNATAVNNTEGAWHSCDTGKYSGLCIDTPVIINANNSVANIDTGKTFKYLNTDGSLTDDIYYDLILGLNSQNRLKDYFRSENASVKVGEHAIRADKENVQR